MNKYYCDKMNTRFYSKKQEERVAKLFNGKVVNNSGATKFRKGDVIVDSILIECKTSVEEKNSFSIKKEWLLKSKNEAFSMGLSDSILAIDFGDGTDYFLVNANLLKKLINNLKENNND